MIDHTHVCEVQGCADFDPTEGACATHPGATVLSLPQERPTKFAAVGSDGRREVVWGLGATEDGALADGRFQLGLNECESDLCVVEVSKAQASAIENGDVSWPPDVSGSIDVWATFFRPSSCLHDVEGALDVDVTVEFLNGRVLSGEVTMVPSHSDASRYVAYGDCPDTWVERPFLLSLREAISGAQDVEERELLCQIEDAARAFCRESAQLQGVRLDGEGLLVDGHHRLTTID